MTAITLTPATIRSKTEFNAYSNRARIGYIKQSGDEWFWELSLLSEQFKGYPRGFSASRDGAQADVTRMFAAWCRAAGLTQPTGE